MQLTGSTPDELGNEWGSWAVVTVEAWPDPGWVKRCSGSSVGGGICLVLLNPPSVRLPACW